LLAYLASAALLVALALLIVWLYRTPPRLEVRRIVPQHAFEGSSVPYRLTVRVRTALPVRILLEDQPPRTLVPSTALDFGGLLWGNSEHELNAQLKLNRRGVFQWPDMTLRWADPFGLRWRTTALKAAGEVIVYPATHGLVLPNLLRPLLSEGALVRSVGLEDPLSLRGTRPYVPGDPPQRVAWKLSAKADTLMIRELERTASSSVQIHLDLAGSETYVESAVRLAASLVREALEVALPVRVSTPSGATESGATPEALQLALRKLAEARPERGGTVIPTPKLGSNVVVLTQNASDSLVQAAMNARAGASRVVIVAMPEGFYLEPGEKGRRMPATPPDQVRELERRAGILAEAGVAVFVLRGNHSILRLGS